MKTNLKDVNGKEICIGDIVQWYDPEGIRTARVVSNQNRIGFHCFKNSEGGWAVGHTFWLDNFMYQDTENHLRLINKEDSV